jgi:ribonuclease HI
VDELTKITKITNDDIIRDINANSKIDQSRKAREIEKAIEAHAKALAEANEALPDAVKAVADAELIKESAEKEYKNYPVINMAGGKKRTLRNSRHRRKKTTRRKKKSTKRYKKKKSTKSYKKKKSLKKKYTRRRRLY